MMLSFHQNYFFEESSKKERKVQTWGRKEKRIGGGKEKSYPQTEELKKKKQFT